MTTYDLYTSIGDFRNGEHYCGKQGKTIKITNYNDSDGKATLLKPKGIYNKVIDVSFGTAIRQCIVTPRFYHINACHTEQELAERIKGITHFNHYDGVMFVKHPLDKVYTRRTWVAIPVSERNRISSGRVEYLNDPLFTPSKCHKFFIVREKWIRWGTKDICYDNGLSISPVWDEADNQYLRTGVNKDALQIGKFSSKFVSEFATNPFSDGHAQPRVPFREWMGETFFVNQEVKSKYIRASVKAYKWKRTIKEAVFAPERVAKMVEKYGDEWMESI
jgi:hypothetical protein